MLNWHPRLIGLVTTAALIALAVTGGVVAPRWIGWTW
jgi:hypothetical protein